MFVVMHDNHISTSQQKYRFIWTSKNICIDAGMHSNNCQIFYAWWTFNLCSHRNGVFKICRTVFIVSVMHPHGNSVLRTPKSPPPLLTATIVLVWTA